MFEAQVAAASPSNPAFFAADLLAPGLRNRGQKEFPMNRAHEPAVSKSARRRFFVSGEPFEVWENPEAVFRSGKAQVESYARRGRWDLVFNALVLRSSGLSAS